MFRLVFGPITVCRKNVPAKILVQFHSISSNFIQSLIGISYDQSLILLLQLASPKEMNFDDGSFDVVIEKGTNAGWEAGDMFTFCLGVL